MTAPEELLEIKLSHGKWVKVDRYIFRSWTGERRRDGVAYNGPVFMLGTRDRFRKAWNRGGLVVTEE